MGLMSKYDLTLILAGQSEEGVFAIQSSYPEVGVGQILKCINTSAVNVHFSKLKCST